MKRSVLVIQAVLILTLLAMLPVGAEPPTRAGTIITNQAIVDYKNLGGEAFQVLSNIVETSVSVVPGVDVSDGVAISAKPGEVVTFAHTLMNTGNAPDTIAVTVSNSDALPYEVFVDIDGDSILTVADIPFADTDTDGIPDTGILEPGQSLMFFIRVTVPSDAPLTMDASFTTTVASGIDASVTDSSEDVISVDQALPYIDVHDSPQYAYRGTEYEFKVSFGNNGDIPMDGVSISVPIPSVLEFITAGGTWSYDPVNRLVVWDIGSMPAASSYTFSVRVRVITAGPGIAYVLNAAVLAGDHGTLMEDSEPTGLVTGAPAVIFLVADPDVIVGDGVSQSLLTATVLDILGNPVPDGTPVTFSTEAGAFLPNGLTTYSTTTTDGIAQVVLISPLLYGLEPISNMVEVSAGTEETGKAYDSILIIFSPAGILGIVWNGNTDQAVTGVLTELVDSTGGVVNSTITNDEGRYLLVAPMIDRYIVRVYTMGTDPKGIVEMPVNVERLQGAIWSTQCAILGKVEVEASLTGAGSSATPAVDAEISLYKDGTLIAQTVSDELGEFRFLDLPRGNYLIKAVSKGGSLAYLGAVLDNDGEILIANLLQLHSPGKVYDATNLAPIEGAKVTLLYAAGPLEGLPVPLPASTELLYQDNPMFTDTFGRYIFFVQPGEYMVKAEAFGYQEYLSEPFINEGPVVNFDIPMLLIQSTQLSILKTTDKSNASPSEDVRFTITWSNTSKASLSGLMLVDMLPEGITVNEPSISGGGIYDSTTRTITWSYESVDADSEKRQETFVANIDDDVADGRIILNRADISSEGGAKASSSAMVLVARHPGITITKEAASASASTGDIVTYRIIVSNVEEAFTPMAAHDVRVTDTLPVGFTYVGGSTLIGGVPSTDPQIAGREMTWSIGDVQIGMSCTIVYKTSVGAGALKGDGINTAVVTGMGEFGYPFEEGPASARVLLKGPAFSMLGIILGKVFNDGDRDGIQDPGETGIANIELIMDDGMRVLTDADGLYHINQVKPGVRSIKLNKSTLPEGAELTNGFSDFLGVSGSFFVNVLPSGTARADFAVWMPEVTASASISAKLTVPDIALIEGGGTRMKGKLEITNSGTGSSGELEVRIKGIVAETGATVVIGDPLISVKDVAPGSTIELPIDITVESVHNRYNSILLGAAVSSVKEKSGSAKLLIGTSAVSVLHAAEAGAAAEGYAITLPAPVSLSYIGHITVRTVSPIGRETRLAVNGKVQTEDRIGAVTKDGVRGITAIEYISVGLEQGENVLQLLDAGTGRQMASAIVLMPGQAVSSMVMTVPSGEGLNIGSRIAMSVLAMDRMSLPAGKNSDLAAFVTGAEFTGADLDAKRDGYQPSANEKGNYDLVLSVTDDKAKVSLTMLVGKESKETEISELVPHDRPAFISGTIELAHNLARYSDSYIKARAFFRKEFAGGVLILRYDSEQGPDDGLFSNAYKDDMYEMYGDDSRQENSAPSAGPFYASLVTRHFSAMWGDFQPQYEDVELAGFRTKMTGFSASLGLGKLSISGFVAPQREGTVTERINGNGTSGYYFTSTYPLLPGSETIYVIRTRYYDDESVFDRTPLNRNVDYQIEYETGAILLEGPLPTCDAEGNRYHLEVTYHSLGGSTEGIAAGARVRTDLGPLELGATTAIEATGGHSEVVLGADASFTLGSVLKVYAEAASYFDEGTFGGYAVRAGAEARIGKIVAELETVASDGGFIKPGETVPMPQQITLYGKAGIEESQDLILGIDTKNTWKGASFDYSSYNKLTAGYRLPLGIGLSLGMTTTYTYESVTDAKGAIIDAFAMLEPLPQLSLRASAQVAKIGSPKDDDGDYGLSISYKPVSELALTLAYTTGTEAGGRYHSLSMAADLAVTAEGKLYGRLSLPFGSKSARTLSLGYKDAYTLSKGLKASFAAEGAIGFDPSGRLSAETSKAAASASLEYTASSGFRASLKQELSYTSSGLTSLSLVDLSVKAADWLSLQGNAACYYGNSPNREGLPLLAEASFSVAARPENTIVTGLLRLDGKYYTGERFGAKENAVIATASTDWTFEAGKHLSVTAKAAYKLAAEAASGEPMATSHLMLLQTGVSLHVTKTTDTELFFRSIGWNENWKYGYSVQVVQKVFSLLSVAVGYNSKDLSDTDIMDAKPWQEGFYIKALIKF